MLNQPLKVFVSHAGELTDDEFALQLTAALASLVELKYIELWHYRRDLRVGAEWKKKVNDALNTADIFIFLLSSNFFNSEFCKLELRHAIARSKSGRKVEILPIKIVDFHFPAERSGDLDFTRFWTFPTGVYSSIEAFPSRHTAWAQVAALVHQVAETFPLLPEPSPIGSQKPLETLRLPPLSLPGKQFVLVKERNGMMRLILPSGDSAPEVKCHDVETAIGNIRAGLMELSKKYISEPPEKRFSENTRLDLLRQLASAGQMLRDLLFGDHALPNSQTDEGEPSTVDPQYLVQIMHEKLPRIPWGVLFESEVRGAAVDTLTESELFMGFWGIKYNVACIYDQTFRANLLHRQEELFIDTDDLVGAFNSDALIPLVGGGLEPWPNPAPKVTTREDLRAQIEKPSRGNITSSLFYFFCHCKDATLYLGNDAESVQTIYEKELVTWIERIPGRRFFFFNGCSPLDPTRPSAWLKLAAENDSLGCVGTEAAVPTRFAWGLGMDFISLLVESKNDCGEAMRTLRLKHWPLSLLYGLHCLPQMRITRLGNFSPTQIFSASSFNLSLLDMGSRIPAVTLPFNSFPDAR